MDKQLNHNASASKTTPPVDFYLDQNEYRMVADMPGVKKEAVQIKTEGGYLEISAKRDDLAKKWHALHLENDSDGYFRKLKLPNNADLDKVQASMQNGVLTIDLPLLAESQPRQINIL